MMISFLYGVFGLATVLLLMWWWVNRPRRVRFFRALPGMHPEKELNPYFVRAWACLETTNRPTIAMQAPDTCPLCGRHVKGRYGTHYRFGRYAWSGLEREHMMYAHVTHGGEDGYYLPDPVFVHDVMEWYNEVYLPMAQTHYVMPHELR